MRSKQTQNTWQCLNIIQDTVSFRRWRCRDGLCNDVTIPSGITRITQRWTRNIDGSCHRIIKVLMTLCMIVETIMLCSCCIYIWLFFTTFDTTYMFLGFHSNYIQKQSLQKYNQYWRARSLLIELLFLLWEEEGLAAWPADIGGIVFVKINLPGYKPVMDHTTAISKLLYLSKTQMIKGSFLCVL